MGGSDSLLFHRPRLLTSLLTDLQPLLPMADAAEKSGEGLLKLLYPLGSDFRQNRLSGVEFRGQKSILTFKRPQKIRSKP